MTHSRTLRILLWAVNFAGLVGTFAVALWAAFAEVSPGDSVTADWTAPAATVDADDRQDDEPSLNHFAGLWTTPLQRPLYDVEAKKTPRPKPPVVAPSRLKLLGTIVEPKSCFAVFLIENRRVEVRQEGETLEGVRPATRVLSVRQDSVVVGDDTRKTTLRLVKANPF